MVRLSCGVQCANKALFALNILFLLIGFTVMGMGIYIKTSKNLRAISEIYSMSEAFGSETMQWVGVGMMIVGTITVCLAAFGCLGAFFQNRGFLYTYSVFVILIILFEFAAVIVTLVFRNNLWQSYDSGFREIFHHAYSQNQTDIITTIEKLEHEFQCCGVDGASDYLQYGYKISKSCYPHQSPMSQPYNQGCAAAVSNWVSNKLPIIAGILGSILFIEIFAIISSLVIGVAISHSLQAEHNDEHNDEHYDEHYDEL